MKISEDKKEITFSGPFYGEISESNREAEVSAKKLVDETRSGAVITRIFKLPDNKPFAYAMEQARPIFDRIKSDMLEAKQIIDRPVPRKKKKGKK
jgi:hypothetical protein